MYFKLALGNVRKSLRDYAIYFLTLVFGVCVFYAFNSILEQSAVIMMSEAQAKMLQLLSTLISGVSVFIAVVLGFLIVYASRYLIRRRKKEFGIYLTLGMDRGKVARVIVYETLVVGLISLLVGLVAGLLVSQGLLYVTAALFEVKMDMFVFIFSWEALLKTVLYFGIMFLIALLFNVIAVSKYQLINLINADKTSEHVTLRSLPVSVVLFVVSLVCIGVAYWLLLDNGLTEINREFALSTVLVCVGTFLFFYALSGFLLRAVQSNRGLYLRGLNMFTFRQLNSKINTAFVSISIVSLALFLAITSTCGGFAICTALTDGLKESTPYDASYTAYYGLTQPQDPAEWKTRAAADNNDMIAAFERDFEGFDTLVSDAAQIDFIDSGQRVETLFDATDYEMDTALNLDAATDAPLLIVSESQYDAALALQGKEPVDLADDEFLIWCNFEDLYGFYEAFLTQNDSFTIAGTELHPAALSVDTTASASNPFAMDTGVVIVPDTVIPDDAYICYSITDLMYNGTRDEVEPLFLAALEKAYPENDLYGDNPGWPYTTGITALGAYEQSTGLSAVVAYLAIYIGFVLLIACAAILALQQLSETADNTARYALLAKLGTEEEAMNKALFRQIAIYFVFPLIIALCHSYVALRVVSDVVELFGDLKIAQPLAITVALTLVIYGGYFLVTYLASKGMLRTKRNRIA